MKQPCVANTAAVLVKEGLERTVEKPETVGGHAASLKNCNNHCVLFFSATSEKQR